MNERDQLILSFREQISYHVNNALRKTGGSLLITKEDLESVAWIELIKCIDRFDATQSCKLSTYADFRIRGAIQDYYRYIDPVSRGHRKLIQSGKSEPIIFLSLLGDETLYPSRVFAEL